MPNKNGFTLMDVLISLTILGILAAMTMPTYNNFLQQAAANAATNNLISIYAAEKNYYLGKTGAGHYCINTSAPPCDSTPDINTNLTLNLNDSHFSYLCVTGPVSAKGFQCTATNISDDTFVLTMTNNPIVLPGSTSAHNPSCTYLSHPYDCPN